MERIRAQVRQRAPPHLQQDPEALKFRAPLLHKSRVSSLSSLRPKSRNRRHKIEVKMNNSRNLAYPLIPDP